MSQGSYLNSKWNVKAKHALYHYTGKWYHVLHRFPGAYFDKNGYIVFKNEHEYRSSQYLNISREVNIPSGISQIPEYVRFNSDNQGTWCEAVLSALHRQASKNDNAIITRQQLLDEELPMIISETNSKGVTPEQTLSRTLQELRDDKQLYFFGDGSYLLLSYPLDIDKVDLPDDVVDAAIEDGDLKFKNVSTSDDQVLARRRKGQARIRQLTLDNYGHQCALCDVNIDSLLVASHIVRWADDIEARGDLTNIICLCCFHDALFEQGYIYLTNDYEVRMKSSSSKTVTLNLNVISGFRLPKDFPPELDYLQQHRRRTENSA
jgi:hypothetical protein